MSDTVLSVGFASASHMLWLRRRKKKVRTLHSFVPFVCNRPPYKRTVSVLRIMSCRGQRTTGWSKFVRGLPRQLSSCNKKPLCISKPRFIIFKRSYSPAYYADTFLSTAPPRRKMRNQEKSRQYTSADFGAVKLFHHASQTRQSFRAPLP